MWRTLAGRKDFMDRVKARYAELRRTVLSKETLNRFIDGNAALLDEAKDRQFAKYSGLLQSQDAGDNSSPWGWFIDRAGGTSMFAAYTVSSYAEEIKILKQWLSDRLDFLDSQWLDSDVRAL